MERTQQAQSEGKKMICRRCNAHGSELKVLGCGCTMHAMCFPISSFNAFRNECQAAVRNESMCPACNKVPLTGIYLFPMSLSEIEDYEGNKDCHIISNSTNHFYASIAPILHLSCSPDNPDSSTCDEVQFRNGRWTTEEINYVDNLMKLFDSGSLPIPHGLKLNDFLRGALLCKSTRLRKKMKNANFCTRTFDSTSRGQDMNYYEMLSKSQENFLSSLETEIDRIVMRFNISRMWGTHFLNFCLQVSYESLFADDWLSSLEKIERRATKAKEILTQNERRKRVDMASSVKVSFRPSTQSILTAMSTSITQQNNEMMKDYSCMKSELSEHEAKTYFPSATASNPFSQSCQDDNSHQEQTLEKFPSTGLDDTCCTISEEFIDDSTNLQSSSLQNPFKAAKFHISLPQPKDGSNYEKSLKSKRARIEKSLTLNNASDISELCGKFGDWHPFMEKVTDFMQAEDLPFEYVDVWVATDNSDELPNEVLEALPGKNHAESFRLSHVGHATRCDTDSILTLYHMNEFGRYSSNFAFPPGVGLPGRVFTSGVPTWDDSVQAASLVQFPRLSGARTHGVKKALGIPLYSPSIGRIIIAMYSNENIYKDVGLVQKCCKEFQDYRPEPKWRLQVDIGSIEAKSAVPESKNGLIVTGNTTNDSMDDSIASLLGRHMPISNNSTSSSSFLSNFISLRLLLLRTPSHRTDSENEQIDIIRKSYKHFMESNRKEGDVANLLVRDWMFLKTDFEIPTEQNNGQSSKPGPQHNHSGTKQSNSDYLDLSCETQKSSEDCASPSPIQRISIVDEGRKDTSDSDSQVNMSPTLQPLLQQLETGYFDLNFMPDAEVDASGYSSKSPPMELPGPEAPLDDVGSEKSSFMNDMNILYVSRGNI